MGGPDPLRRIATLDHAFQQRREIVILWMGGA
jgi:hypothetical protein